LPPLVAGISVGAKLERRWNPSERKSAWSVPTTSTRTGAVGLSQLVFARNAWGSDPHGPWLFRFPNSPRLPRSEHASRIQITY